MAHLYVSPRVFVRRPPSVIVEGSNGITSSAPGSALYSDIQHPTRDRAYITGNFGGITAMAILDISDRAAPIYLGNVSDAAGLMGNEVIDGLAFDSTGRYLYATSGATSLYTFDLGVAFADEDDPPLVNTDTDLSQGNGKHVVKRIGTRLFVLADTVTNNSFQEYDISTPSNPSLTLTTAMTGQDLEASSGYVNVGEEVILYPASDLTGKVIAVPIDAPTLFEVLQLPTVGGLQVRCTAGIAFSPDDSHMLLSCTFTSGSIAHSIVLIYDVSLTYETDGAVCTNEEIVSGAILSLKDPIIATSPRGAFFTGYFWNDGNDVLHLAFCIRNDSFGELAELRFYAWGAGGDFSRFPRPSGSIEIPLSYSMRARNESATKTDWLSVGVSQDRANIAFATIRSDLLESAPDYENDWFEFEDILSGPGLDLETGMEFGGHVAHTGTLNFKLNNSEINDATNLGGYSPDSPTPVTTEFQIGSPVIYTMNTGAGSVPRFYGTVVDIRPEPDYKGERFLEVSCKDGMKVLHEANVERLPLRSNVTTDEALKILIDRIPYLPGTEFFTASMDSYVHSFINDRAYDERTKSVEVIKQLLEASQGFFYPSYFGSLGGLVYKSLDDYKLSPAYNGGHTILSANITDMEVVHSDEEIFNSITVRYYPRLVDTGSDSVLFTMEGGRIRIRPGETVQIEAQYRDPAGLASRVGGTDMVYPEVATDYTLRQNKNGGGANLNAQLSVSAEFGSTSALIAAQNDGPLIGWYKTQLRGNGVYTLEPEDVTVRDRDSITKYGLRELSINAPYIDNFEDAIALAKAHLEAKKEPRTHVRSVEFYLKDSGPTVPAATIGLTGKVGVQELVTGLMAPDWWALGTGKLGDAAGSDNANLYGLDMFSVQKIRLNVKERGHARCTLDLISEESIFRTAAWIDPRADWLTDEPIFGTLFNLHLYDNVRSIWHEKATQSADVSSTTTTFAAATDMTFFVEAGDTWEFFAFIFVDSNATANAKVTVKGYDVSSNDISSILSGRLMLWGNGNPIGDGNTAVFGNPLNANLAGTDEDCLFLSGRVTSPIFALIQLEVAQNTASGTSTFRENAVLIPFLAERTAL